MDNERRADLGIASVRAAASVTNVWRVEPIETSITDVLAYIAHTCDRFGLDPELMFEAGLNSYRGDSEDGPPARELADGYQRTFAELGVWGE
jgi:hypothetical protein